MSKYKCRIEVDYTGDSKWKEYDQFDPIKLIEQEKINLYHSECAGGEIIWSQKGNNNGALICKACGWRYHKLIRNESLRRSLRRLLVYTDPQQIGRKKIQVVLKS